MTLNEQLKKQYRHGNLKHYEVRYLMKYVDLINELIASPEFPKLRLDRKERLIKMATEITDEIELRDSNSEIDWNKYDRINYTKNHMIEE